MNEKDEIKDNKANKRKLCFDYWFSRPFDGYNSDDEYGNGCYGPADTSCPICNTIQGLSDS